MKRKKGNMDMCLFKKIIDEIAYEDKNTELWMTFYGEALILRYRLYYMIEYTKRKGLNYVVLNSNAMLLDKEMVNLLIDSGLDRFIISIDGFTKETYEKIRVGGNREQVYANVLYMLELLKKRNIKRPILEVQYSVMDENERELEDFKNFWFEKGAHVKIREKLSWAGTVQAGNLNPYQNRIACPWALRTCAIYWDGGMCSCAVDYDRGFVSGDVNDKSIKEIWNTTHREFQKLHLNHKFALLPEICKNCLDWQAIGATTYDNATRKPAYWRDLLK